MKKSELQQIIREEIGKALTEFGPMYASRNYRRGSPNPLVNKIGKLDSQLMDTDNMKANMQWDEYTSDLFHQNNAKYWADLDDQELEDAIAEAEAMIRKYKVK